MNFTKSFTLWLTLLLLAVTSFVLWKNRNSEMHIVQLGIVGHWRTLHPGLQHTAVGDMVLSNQFEALVGISDSGIVGPGAAKSWQISEDFRTITFNIDTSRKYSDGSQLEASDFKRSWEQSLQMESRSANSSALDVLYALEGFDEFEKTKQLSGVKAISKDLLELRFRSPFRLALTHLSGDRFAAFKESHGKYFGTGPYVIRALGENELEFTPNTFHTSSSNHPHSIRLRSIEPNEIIASLTGGAADAVVQTRGESIPNEYGAAKNLSVFTGTEVAHTTALVNGTPGRLLSDRRFRLALQTVLLQICNERPDAIGNSEFLRIDPQSFLPQQPGRLSETETADLVQLGSAFINELKERTKVRPLHIHYIHSAPRTAWIIERLKSHGIEISTSSGPLDNKSHLEFFYKTPHFDLLFASFSVVQGDPDGIYHKLGKHGAILTPVTYREEVGRLLEEGRQIIGQEKLDEHYKKVSRAILTEVPYIHLGFSKSVTLVRNDRVDVDNVALRRNEGHFGIFKLK